MVQLIIRKGKFIVTPLKDEYYDISIEESDSLWHTSSTHKSFDQCIKDAQENFTTWTSSIPSTPQKYSDARTLASYTLWSSTLNEGGNLTRPGILMSKNWMHYIWSWDHCFNAMACAYHLPETAWDQFIILFDHQRENGQIPDLIGRGRSIYDYLKPPIHGWALKKIMNHFELTQSQTKEAYLVLGKWTNFWLTQRDTNKNGLPEYNHGNDSGWDNGTEFDLNGKEHKRANRESANLHAYLIIQMDVLHDLALKLGKEQEANIWKQKSDNLLKLMITNNWNGSKFLTKDIDNDTSNIHSQSLMAYLPLVLGEKLPKDIRTQLINELKNNGFITQWGLATESLNSRFYNDDGYWRGPIWAPSTLIIVDGLEQCGEHELAKDIARKFCDLCLKSGFAENFNAKTGEGLRDIGYTWTASVFLIMAHDYLMD